MLPRLHIVYGSVKLYLHIWNLHVPIPVQLGVKGQESDHRQIVQSSRITRRLGVFATMGDL